MLVIIITKVEETHHDTHMEQVIILAMNITMQINIVTLEVAMRKQNLKDGGAIIIMKKFIIIGEGMVHKGEDQMKGTIIKEKMVHHWGHPKQDHLQEY